MDRGIDLNEFLTVEKNAAGDEVFLVHKTEEIEIKAGSDNPWFLVRGVCQDFIAVKSLQSGGIRVSGVGPTDFMRATCPFCATGMRSPKA